MKVRHSARTDVGRTRDHNEDSYGIGSVEQAERLGALLVVCDGMGGHAAGEVASAMAAQTIIADYYAADIEERPLALEYAFDHANQQIYASGRGTMGTTGVAALLYHDALHVANVGDSRAYLIRGGEIRQISRDHSFVNDQVAAGLITPEQARSSPHRNVITRALGYQAEVSIDLFRLPVQVGDIVLLCSDGLHGLVRDEELADLIIAQPPEQAVEQLIALANERGGIDNITVVIAHVDDLDWETDPLSDDDLAAEAATQPASALPALVEQPILTEPMVRPPTPAPAASPLFERRLTLLGGLLATLLLAVLLISVLFLLNQPGAAPEPVPQITVIPATALATPALTPTAPPSPSASRATATAPATPAATPTPRITPTP